MYVDHDPRAVQIGRDLIGADPMTRFARADVIDVDAVLDSPEIRELIDLSEPVGLLATAVFHFIGDEDDPWSVAARYIAAIASGSYCAMSHGGRRRPGPLVLPMGRPQAVTLARDRCVTRAAPSGPCRTRRRRLRRQLLPDRDGRTGPPMHPSNDP